MSAAIRDYTEVSREYGVVTVAESGLYSVGSQPADEASLNIDYVTKVTLVDAAGASIVLNFAAPPVAIGTLLIKENLDASGLANLATSRQSFP